MLVISHTFNSTSLLRQERHGDGDQSEEKACGHDKDTYCVIKVQELIAVSYARSGVCEFRQQGTANRSYWHRLIYFFVYIIENSTILELSWPMVI